MSTNQINDLASLQPTDLDAGQVEVGRQIRTPC